MKETVLTSSTVCTLRPKLLRTSNGSSTISTSAQALAPVVVAVESTEF